MRKIFLGTTLLGVLAMPLMTFAVQNDFEIIPEADSGGQIGQDVKDIGNAGGSVWDKLNQKASQYETDQDLGAQFATGAFTRNTILNYVVYLVRFLSQAALVIGGAMIIYAGYKYAMSSFGEKPDPGLIKNAIIGVLIVTFSYALIRILTEAFL